jgi:hypothetical protein
MCVTDVKLIGTGDSAFSNGMIAGNHDIAPPQTASRADKT